MARGTQCSQPSRGFRTWRVYIVFAEDPELRHRQIAQHGLRIIVKRHAGEELWTQNSQLVRRFLQERPGDIAMDIVEPRLRSVALAHGVELSVAILEIAGQDRRGGVGDL